jgi:Notch-like protein
MNLFLGICIITNGSNYQCVCPTGWTDRNCTIPISPCASLPCRNNGQCITLSNQFLCVCSVGFTGALCALPINPCSSNPCKMNFFSLFKKEKEIF